MKDNQEGDKEKTPTKAAEANNQPKPQPRTSPRLLSLNEAFEENVLGRRGPRRPKQPAVMIRSPYTTEFGSALEKSKATIEDIDSPSFSLNLSQFDDKKAKKPKTSKKSLVYQRKKNKK